MKTIFPATAVAALIITTGAAPAQAANRQGCEYEDSNSCVWDARHMGNGSGESFKVNEWGKVTYISHRRAHRLLGLHTE